MEMTTTEILTYAREVVEDIHMTHDVPARPTEAWAIAAATREVDALSCPATPDFAANAPAIIAAAVAFLICPIR